MPSWKKFVRGMSRGLRGIIAVGDARYLRKRDLSGGLTANIAGINRGTPAGGAQAYDPTDADVVTSVAIDESGSVQLKGDVTLSAGAGIDLTQTANDIEIANTLTDVVTSIAIDESGAVQLTGDVTLSEGANITLTQSGQDIEIAATAAPFDRLELLDRAIAQIIPYDASATPPFLFPGIGILGVTANVLASADTADGVGISLETTPVSGNAAFVSASQGAGLTRLDMLPIVGGKTTTNLNTSQRNWIGLFEGDPSGADDPAGLELIGFRASTGASDTNWQACSKDGTTLNVEDTGVSFDAATHYEFAIEVVSTGSVKFYIDGALVKTVTANLPAATTVLKWYDTITTLTLGTRKRTFHQAMFILK